LLIRTLQYRQPSFILDPDYKNDDLRKAIRLSVALSARRCALDDAEWDALTEALADIPDMVGAVTRRMLLRMQASTLRYYGYDLDVPAS
jgi:hypothetical protein